MKNDPSSQPKPTRSTYFRRRARRRATTALIAAACLAGIVLLDRAGWLGTLPPEDVTAYDGKCFAVLKVIDGDTIHIDIPDRRENRPYTIVRFWGVDTPELARDTRAADHFGAEAARYLREMLQGASVRVQLEPGKEPRGKYHRLLAWIYLQDAQGSCLNETLISGGYGYADPRFRHSRMRALARLQQEACDNRRGLWKAATKADLPGYFAGRRNPLDRRR